MINVLMWVALIGYFVCLVPQIMTNFKFKSGTAISEFMLLGYLNAYLFLMFYIFGVKLPLAYRIMVPAALIATIILIVQRLYYDSTASRRLYVLYLGNILFFIICIPYALKNPVGVGFLFGWFNLGFSIINQVPQIVKIYCTKSVMGFSFMFVVLNGVAAMCETIAAFAVPLPLPTCVSAVRALVIVGIFCWQFHLYRS